MVENVEKEKVNNCDLLLYECIVFNMFVKKATLHKKYSNDSFICNICRFDSTFIKSFIEFCIRLPTIRDGSFIVTLRYSNHELLATRGPFWRFLRNFTKLLPIEGFSWLDLNISGFIALITKQNTQ